MRNRIHNLAILAVSAFTLLALLFTFPRVAAQEDELEPLRALWREARYRQALGPLGKVRLRLGEMPNFEVDYMVATTLCNLKEYHMSGCEYFRSMAGVYDLSQPQVVDGQSHDAQQTMQDCCKPEAGAKVVFALLPPRKRSVILSSIATDSQVSEEINPKTFAGYYDMIHDGWRGTLRLNPPRGEYIASDGRTYRVLVKIYGYHIIFFILDLGGENAEGSGGQKFDGYLMTQTKDAIAGLTWWNGSPFGFYAIRK